MLKIYIEFKLKQQVIFSYYDINEQKVQTKCAMLSFSTFYFNCETEYI